MTDKKRPDLNDLLRRSRSTNKVDWEPEDSPDPAVRQRDRDALNAAIRRASGRDDPESDSQPFPWRSLGDDDREDGS
jgi:hypothetical protein